MGKRIKLTEAQKDEAYQAAISGGNPIKVLGEFGCKNPSSTWSMIKKQLKKESPESYLRLPDKYKPASERATGKIETPEGTLADAMQGMKDAADDFFGQWLPNVETPEAPKAPKKRTLEHRKTGIDTEIGEFHYYRRSSYLDWSPDGSFQDTVSLKVEEWQALMELFPIVAEELGVEL